MIFQTFQVKLCREGYFVICIQHDLPEDSELPRTDNLFEKRKPLWKNAKHLDLHDSGPEEIKREIMFLIDMFIKKKL